MVKIEYDIYTFCTWLISWEVNHADCVAQAICMDINLVKRFFAESGIKHQKSINQLKSLQKC
jgi:hypothetical protein